MAKKFAGFKPETLNNKILPALGYNGPADQKSINEFLASNPAAAAKMGKYTLAARRAVEGTPVKMAAGGFANNLGAFLGASTTPAVRPSTMDIKQDLPEKASLSGIGDALLNARDEAQQPVAPSQPSAANTFTEAVTADPRSVVVKAPTVASMGEGTTIAEGTGQLTAPAGTATQTVAQTAPAAVAAPVTPAATVEAAQAAPAVDQALQQQQAAQGVVSQEAQMQAAQMAPQDLAQLGLQAAQGEAATVQGAPTRTLDQAELVSGTTVDQQRVGEAFGTGEVEAATVSGELAGLMEDFDTGTPPWAAGAMRAANAQLAARGLSNSSMAGMAIVQAAMESALPIAQMDASNKQQVALMKAEQRAKFMGMEFDQNFQTKVMNAAKISEIANMNFTAQQQVALENAKMAQTMNLANLSNRQAKVMADAAAMSQMDMANLNNRQQAQVQNAQAFLQMDMTNLSNEQQMNMFKAQERVNSILSDTAATNAARQFNATSENQTNQFFASLATQVSQFNTEQTNAMNRFNAGEANAIEQFNTTQNNLRDQFNATNQLVIAQANAQWAAAVTTAANAADNQANRDAALAANNFTMTAYNNIVQRDRDLLAWAWQSAESAAERDANLAIAKIQNTKSGSSAASKGLGSFLGQLALNAANLIMPTP